MPRLVLSFLLAIVVVAATVPSAVVAAPAASTVTEAPVSADNPRVWPPARRDRPLRLGVVEAFRVPGRATEAGVQWGRVLFDWSVIQRNGPGQWEVGWLDEGMARQERDAGRPTIGTIMSTPSWASGTSDPKSPPRGLDLPVDDPRNVWATWVRTLVGRYAGLINTWVIWNEPDVWSDETGTRQWDGTPEQYYRLLKVAYVAARQANPNATILMAGMTYWWDEQYGREQYFSRVLKAAAADPTAPANNWYFDGAVLQLYNNPRGLFDAPRAYRATMRAHGFEKPVWVNETNTVPWDDPVAPLTAEHYRATMDEQASYLVQAAAYALASGVERLAVYKLLDDNPIKKGVEQAFGMVRDDPSNSVRPVFTTFQVLARELGPTTRAQLVDEGSVNRVYLEQPSLGRRLTVLWTTGPNATPVSLVALGTTAQVMDKFGRVQLLPVAEDGLIRLTLAGATANTVPGFPDTYFIGGDPVLLLEPLSADYQPLTATVTDSLPPLLTSLTRSDSAAPGALPSRRRFRL